jgi:adenylate kinase family enzyme
VKSDRVVVVGTSCSGKATFARRLASILGTHRFELDSLYWGPGWKLRPDFQQEVLAAAQQPRWVIDGNYSGVRDIIWRRCTAIVWLDYSFARVFSRALRRTVRRVVIGEHWAVVVTAVVVGVRWLRRHGSFGTTPTPLEILRARYARGELTRQDFESMRRDLDA